MAVINCPRDSFIRITYEVGDVVRLISGDAPQRVLKIILRRGQQYLFCQYLSGSHYHNQWGQPYHNRARSAEDFVLLQDCRGESAPQPQEKEPMTKLYQTKTGGPVAYGTLLARNSAGLLVLEMKGSGDVQAFKESDVELVVPYTVRLKSVAGDRQIDVQIPKGTVEKHDLVLTGNGLYIVTVLDTKSDAKALGKFRVFKGTLVAGEAVDAEEADD